jgi:hypothetical protein
MITIFQNLKLNMNGAEAMMSKVANNAYEAANHGGRTITSPLTPLHARLNASMWKHAQVGYCIPVYECVIPFPILRFAHC